ncbi:MAG TPA: MFS transporter [Anaerolineales bacterium]|nr:MFS transporter [Anaerolineales bacterium]
MAQTVNPTNDKREIFGWAMYDWANSAFSTTVGTVFLGPYVASLAAEAAKGNADGLARLGSIAIAPDSFFPACVSLSVLAQVFVLPILGAIADYSHRRKQMLQLFATLGALQTILMFFITGSIWWLGGLLFFGANVAFGAAVVFYNAYLPDIASEDQRDRVSSFGWAMGYLGDGILLALNLAFFMLHERLGVPTSLAIRINLASAGIWWLSFSFITWERLRPRHAHRVLPEGENYLKTGFRQLLATLREIRRFPETIKFLLAFFLYNDGIQTVIAVASTFAAAPLIRGGLELDINTLTIVILIIQFTAFFGALLWGRLAAWIGSKTSVLISLIIWSAVVIYAYFGMKGDQRVLEFGLLGVVIALVLGGSQAISRSIFAQMIPAGREAEFYSFYEVSDRGTSWLGPAVFAITNQMFGSLRPAILSLIVFFVAGLIALPFVDIRKGIEDVKNASSRQHAEA